ncbi:hypothetical protein ES702_02684 [subsurface metagenome]
MRKTIPKLLSLKETAEVLGISKQSLWQWIKEGQFPIARRVGSLWKIPEDELREFLNLEQTAGKRSPKRTVKLLKKKKIDEGHVSADDSYLLRNIWQELIRLRKLLEEEIGKKKKKPG